MRITQAMRALQWAALVLAVAAVAGCASGPARRVSEPAASIQQLTVRADGSWSVDLRIENFSNVPMRFESVSLPLNVAGESAGTLQGSAGIEVGPESADVVTLAHAPSSTARMAVADALAGNRAVAYSFEGTLAASPDEGRSREWKIKRSSSLNPVPGLAGVLR